MNTSLHFSSATPEWATPQYFFDKLNAEFSFTLDPCCTHENAKCAKHYTKEDDGLMQDWTKDVTFVNPPYGRPIKDWVKKSYESAQGGATVVCLVPARTDTRWFQDFCLKGEVRFVRGRLKFGGCANSAPFPSAVVVFRPPSN